MDTNKLNLEVFNRVRRVKNICPFCSGDIADRVIAHDTENVGQHYVATQCRNCNEFYHIKARRPISLDHTII